MEQQILANAELVRTVAREQLAIAVGFDEAGVRWLDRYIDGQRIGANESTKEKLPNTLGSYLGECIRQSFGGTWIEDKEYGWAVRINQQVTVFPFSKVRKQLSSNAEGESVLGLYTSIPALLEEQITTASPSNKRSWWKLW
ncbi:MAG: hypothetical protein ACK5V9_09995 [Burkholderiales bacterium]